MRRLVTPSMILLLAVIHTPIPAQALLFDFFPAALFDLSVNEPVMLLLTGIALLGLARAGGPRSRTTSHDDEAVAPPARAWVVRRADPRSAGPTSTKRAA